MQTLEQLRAGALAGNWLGALPESLAACTRLNLPRLAGLTLPD